MDNEEKREDPNPTRAARTSAQWVKYYNFMFENGDKTPKVLFIFRCSKNWQKKSVHHHLLTNDGAHFFFANFYCSER